MTMAITIAMPISRSARARHTTSSKTQHTSCQTMETTSTGTSTMVSILKKISKMIMVSKIIMIPQPSKKISALMITMESESKNQSPNSHLPSSKFRSLKSKIHTIRLLQIGGSLKQQIKKKTGRTYPWIIENL